MPAVLFVSYLCYGPARPWISRRWRRELEEEDDVREKEEAEEELGLPAASTEPTPTDPLDNAYDLTREDRDRARRVV